MASEVRFACIDASISSTAVTREHIFRNPSMARGIAPTAAQVRPPPTAGTVLAFDFGTQRIGVAVGDFAIGIAHPLATIPGAVKEQRYAAIAALIEEWRPALLAVGLPAHMDGTEHEVSRLARKFARDL